MKMKTREELHHTYGGKLQAFDFGGRITLKEIADRIASDEKFDRKCSYNLNWAEKYTGRKSEGVGSPA